MSIIYKKASLEDISILVSTRVEVLKAANLLDDSTDMSRVENESYNYYKKALSNNTHTAFLVYDEEKIIGAGGVSYYQVMPTYHNPTGEKAYIMNIYTSPDYRRKGIAYKTLDLLVKDAKSRGTIEITLESTDMGRPLYEKYGFKDMSSEMKLQID